MNIEDYLDEETVNAISQLDYCTHEGQEISVVTAIEEALEKAFDAGFERGCDVGYEQGAWEAEEEEEYVVRKRVLARAKK